jgi:hypothetical protein
VAIDRRCPSCGSVLASTSRPDRVFCSATCRSAAYRARQAAESLAPAELARLADALPPAVAGITQAARVDWRAAAWLLERRWPERWAELERATEPRVPGKDEFDWAPDAA